MGGHFHHYGQFINENMTSESYVTGIKLWIRRWDGRPVIGGKYRHEAVSETLGWSLSDRG